MNTLKIIASLKEYGLSEREVKIYLCLLNKIEASAHEIAQITNIPRTSVYAILEGLEKRHLISSLKKNNVVHFTPESPRQLIYTLKRKEEIVLPLLPELEALAQGKDISPLTKLYTGKEGVQIVLEDILQTLRHKPVKKLYAMSGTSWYNRFPRFFRKWLEERQKEKIYTHLIVPPIDKNFKDQWLLESNSYRETRVLPANLSYESAINIYAEKIALFSLKDEELYSIIIESPTLADMFRQFFLLLWEISEKESFT